jgi:hypothetical protein
MPLPSSSGPPYALGAYGQETGYTVTVAVFQKKKTAYHPEIEFKVGKIYFRVYIAKYMSDMNVWRNE